ncbi:Coiled-coil domain-containing protein 73, partial [Apaloderma vittatum]
EILSSLQCVQELLQRITQTNVRMESELKALKEEYQTLERDNELQREKAKENEEKFLNLQYEHEKALRTWKKDEENMRRELDTIKNELSSLKGVHRHFEDYHPPQGNQHSEQVENLQSGQEHSKDSEIQPVQKENGCMQSIIRKDSNFGHEEEIEVKTTMDCSLSTEELQIEQENTLPLTGLLVLENNFKDEVNVASPYEEKQREASPRNTLCTDTDLITQGQTSEIHVTECKEAENLGAPCRMLLDENSAALEAKLQDSTEPLAACHAQRKVFLDSADTVGAYKKNGSQETNSSKQESCSATGESTSTKAGKANPSVLTPEAPKMEPGAVLCTEKNVLCETSTDNCQAKELSFGIPPYINENSQKEYQKCSLLDGDNYVGNRLHNPDKNVLNLSSLNREKLPFKQTDIDPEDRNYDDNARNVSSALRSTGVPATDAQDLPAVYCDNTGSDDVSLLGTSNLCPPKTGINVDDVCSKQPEQDGTEQTENATNTRALNTQDASPVKADGVEIIAHKKTPIDRISTDKLIPCTRVNDDVQIHSIKNGHSPEINHSTKNILLKEKKDSLDSTVPGRKFAEGHLKESCSLPMRTSGNLVNISGRSSFDLSTSDKKAEKTPVYLNFLDFSSHSRVNQMRGQATWTSAYPEPSLLKEKLPCLVENTKFISETQCQNLSENVDRRETEQGSTSFNRAADTLNTSSIHRDPQGDPSEERNATAKTFYDSSFPTEHVSQLKTLQ